MSLGRVVESADEVLNRSQVGSIVVQGEQVAIGGTDLLYALHADAFVDRLNEGPAVVVIPDLFDSGVVHIEDPMAIKGDDGTTTFDIPAVDASTGLLGSGYVPGLVISPERAGFRTAAAR